MRFVALVSGGKDSVFSIAKCLAYGHELVVLANLFPPVDGPEELDSFMFQSAGSSAVECLAECIGVPMVRATMSGASTHQGLQYTPTEGDEVEDLHALLFRVKQLYPEVEAVSSGAVLSTYQRTRVESVCDRLGLQSLAFLWQYDQSQLLKEMTEYGLEAVLVKVSSQGLAPHKHLGKSIAELEPLFKRLNRQHGFHVAGEGGEYETLAIDAPFFKRRLVLDDTEVVIHSDDVYTPVGLLHIHRCHAEFKEESSPTETSKGNEPNRCLVLPLEVAIVRSLADGGPSTSAESLGSQACAVAPGKRARKWRIRPQPHVWRQGRVLNISGYCVPTPRIHFQGADSSTHGEAAGQMRLCLEGVQRVLLEHGLSLHDVVVVHLYLRSMASFAAVNAEYCRAPFHPHHPPSRSCVELPLARPYDDEEACRRWEEVEVLLDVMALAGSGAAMDAGSFQPRQVLHVKSLSGWAPVCIGPYSQANLLSHGHLAFLAGQIGLDPATMVLVKPSDLEAFQALYNCAQVLHALRASLRTVLMVVVYVHVDQNGYESFSPDPSEWEDVCRLDAGWGRTGTGRAATGDKGVNDASYQGANRSDGDDSDEEQDGEEDEANEGQCQSSPCPIFLPVGVPNLPRGAAIEFEVVALSTAFAQVKSPTRRAEQGRLEDILEEKDMGECPLPLPFQPPATFAALASKNMPLMSRPLLSYTWEAIFVPYVFNFVSLSLYLGDDLDGRNEGGQNETLLLNYTHVAYALVDQLRKILRVAHLTWQQLSHLRVFYIATCLDNEAMLREALAAALPSDGQCARTFLPVSSLMSECQEGSKRQDSLFLRVQVIALDLEKLRTEAWVHSVPDGGM